MVVCRKPAALSGATAQVGTAEKFQDPTKLEFNYLREVDHRLAASLMIPAALFAELGGFDPKYAPAYYEDTDLAFKVETE